LGTVKNRTKAAAARGVALVLAGVVFDRRFRSWHDPGSLLLFAGGVVDGYPPPPSEGILGIKYLYSMGYKLTVSVKY
jgi:hypothetical protein